MDWLSPTETSTRGRARRFAAVVCLLLTTVIFNGHATAGGWTELEKRLGKLSLAEMKLRHGEARDPLLQAWVSGLADPLLAHTSRDFDYHFTVLDSYENNAFSLPGGQICVTRGLLSNVVSDEELAGVMAHELAHSENSDFRRIMQHQLLYVGGQSILRKYVSEEWIYGTQIIQVLDGLRQQRKHELQADLEGATLAYQARYDPSGLRRFLGSLRPRRGFGSEVFATHPHPQKRLEAVQDRIEDLQGNDYEGLVALGDSLAERLHHARAAAIYEQAAALQPARPEAPRKLAALREQQGLADPAPEVEIALTEAQRAEVAATLNQLRQAEQELYQAERRLRGNLQRLSNDREIARAMQVAQVIAPETGDPRYLATLARAYYVLAAAWREAVRQGEITSRCGAIRTGWEMTGRQLQERHKVIGGMATNEEELALAAERFTQSVAAAKATTEAVNRAAGVSVELSHATRLLSLAFLALAGSGDHQPLGRVNYTRFLLLQGDVLVAEQRIRKVAKASEQAHAEVVRRHLETLAGQMAVLHATARPELRALDRRLIARRLPVDARQPRLLGPALCELQQMPDLSADRLQSLDAVLRMCYLDMRAERETHPEPERPEPVSDASKP